MTVIVELINQLYRSITVNPRQRMRKGRLIDKLNKLFVDKNNNHTSIIKFRNSDSIIEKNDFDNNYKGFKNISNQRFDYNSRLHNFQSYDINSN